MFPLLHLFTLLFWLLVIGILFVLPVWLLGAGIAGLRRRNGGIVRLSLGVVMLLFALFVLDSHFGPWHRKVLDRGTAPDGRSYALLQVGGGEPFEIRLYVRSEEAGWVFHYVDHEVFPWRSGGHVEFSPDSATAQVFHGREAYKTIDILPPEQTDPYDNPFSTADTPEDILRSLSKT